MIIVEGKKKLELKIFADKIVRGENGSWLVCSVYFVCSVCMCLLCFHPSSAQARTDGRMSSSDRSHSK